MLEQVWEASGWGLDSGELAGPGTGVLPSHDDKEQDGETLT